MGDDSLRKRKMFQFSGIRYVFTAAGFFGFFTIYAIRVNLNVAIVAMVNSSVYVMANSSDDECKITSTSSSNTSSHQHYKEGEFLWSPDVQATILGSFYYGYCISQIPGGRLAEIFSGKWVFGIGTVITALLTLLTPIAARHSSGALIAVRSLEGLSQGVTMPAMHSMIGRWLPDSEKGFLSTIIYSGIPIGTEVTLFLTGMLCDSDFLGGWPSTFYVVGVFGCFWFILWCLFVSDSPTTNPFITQEEINYISSNQQIKLDFKLPPIPWRKILTSVPFWALVITQTASDWGFYTVLNDLPTYFSTILHFTIEKNGFLSSYPHLISTLVGLTVSYTADVALRRELVTKNFIRKFCTAVSFLGVAVFYLGVCFAKCDAALNIAFFTCAIAIGGFYYVGYNLTHLDLSPEYAGTLMGISNTISNLSGFLAPLVIGILTSEHQNSHQWRIILSIVIVMQCIGALIFILFASSEKQNWVITEGQKSLIDSGTTSSKTEEKNREIT